MKWTLIDNIILWSQRIGLIVILILLIGITLRIFYNQCFKKHKKKQLENDIKEAFNQFYKTDHNKETGENND